MVTININDFYGNIKAYRGMSETTFHKLEQAFLNYENTIDIAIEEYEAIISLID